MFFLAFQEFLKYHGKDMHELIHDEGLEDYLCMYLCYCRQHHLCHNLQDVHKELAYQNNC